MAKIKTLTGTPPAFDLDITMLELDGSDAEIGFKCLGRTLRDWHPVAVKRITDDANHMIEAAEARETEAAKKEAPQPEPAAKAKAKAKSKRLEVNAAEMQEAVEKNLSRSAEIIREVATGWDLDDEFSDENIKLMCATYPGVHQRLWEKYDARIRGDRLGK